MILLTQAFPVNGNSHCFRILGLPFLSVCSMVTTTFVSAGFDTKSIAPPNPFTLPGSIPGEGTSELVAWQVAGSIDRVTARSGELTISQVSLGADLHGAQDGEIDSARPDHAETLVAAETAGPFRERNSLLTGID